METDATGEFARILFLLDDGYREIIRVEGDAVSMRAEDEIIRFSRRSTLSRQKTGSNIF